MGNRRNNNKWNNRKGDRSNNNNNNRGGDNNKKTYHGKQNPRRGGPGILLACETGREIKCEREGLEILRHYLYSSSHDSNVLENDGDKIGNNVSPVTNTDSTEDAATTAKVLSMEDEIALLQSGASVDQVLHDDGNVASANTTGNNQKGDKKLKRKEFIPYQTGCRGSVFVMCTLPNCNLIPPIITKDPSQSNDNNNNHQPKLDDNKEESVSSETPNSTSENEDKEKDTEASPPSKRLKMEKEDSSSLPSSTKDEKDSVTKEKYDGCWDPVETVRRVIRGLENCNDEDDNNSKTAPRSRFVTRMIPIQATCFASLFEIEQTAQSLIDKYLLPHVDNDANNNKTCTFKIEFRRRNCSNVTRDQVIDTIASLLLGKEDTAAESDNNNNTTETKQTKFTVNLKNPEYTIQIEICKTLCGMSILKHAHTYQNFNLIEIQERQNDLNKTTDE